MTDLSIDYSFARPAPAAIKAAGYTAVWRYLGGTEGKDLTAAEASQLHAAGLGIGCVFESLSQEPLSGAGAGTADGKAAAAQARAIGLPAGAPLLVAVGDFAAIPGQLAPIHAYYHAFRAETGAWQTGGYATSYIIGELVAQGAEGLWWQSAEDDQGVPGSIVNAHTSVYQRVTPTRPRIAGTGPGDYDEDVYGFGPSAVSWWMPAAPDPAGNPAPSEGAWRWVVPDGNTESLAAFAAGRGTTALELLMVSAEKLDAAAFGVLNDYVTQKGVDAPMPAGMVYYTVHA